MNDNETQKRNANFIAAFTQLLCGKSGAFDDFGLKTRILITSSRPDVDALMQYAEIVRREGSLFIWICLDEAQFAVPLVGLVALIDDQLYVMAECLLWLSTMNAKAKLVPANFQHGAFAFDDDLKFTYNQNAPRKSEKAGLAGLKKAYDKLGELEFGQEPNGDLSPIRRMADAA